MLHPPPEGRGTRTRITMAGYKTRKIVGFEQGLVQDREEFLLVDDAFPVLENAYVWREKVLKKKGHIARGRLRRVLASQSMAVTSAAATYTITDVLATLSLRATEPDAQIQLESFTITFDDGGDQRRFSPTQVTVH